MSHTNQFRFLMCPPHHFGVEYVINPWMQHHVNSSNPELAAAQWNRLFGLLNQHATVALMQPVSGLPDLVFTANAALVHSRTAVLSSFRCLERQPEARHYAEWLASDGFTVKTLPCDVRFEGAGDALFDRRLANLLWLGYGYRSDSTASAYLQSSLSVEAQPLRLIDPRFYHLDTCFCPLEGGYLLYYPPAFDSVSNAAIEARIPSHLRIAVSEQDATYFACNAVNIGDKIILNHASGQLSTHLESLGFEVIPTHMSEFMKAGGSTKCLSLRLNETTLQ